MGSPQHTHTPHAHTHTLTHTDTHTPHTHITCTHTHQTHIPYALTTHTHTHTLTHTHTHTHTTHTHTHTSHVHTHTTHTHTHTPHTHTLTHTDAHTTHTSHAHTHATHTDTHTTHTHTNTHSHAHTHRRTHHMHTTHTHPHTYTHTPSTYHRHTHTHTHTHTLAAVTGSWFDSRWEGHRAQGTRERRLTGHAPARPAVTLARRAAAGPAAGEGGVFLGFAEALQARAPPGWQGLCPACSEDPRCQAAPPVARLGRGAQQTGLHQAPSGHSTARRPPGARPGGPALSRARAHRPCCATGPAPAPPHTHGRRGLGGPVSAWAPAYQGRQAVGR